MKRIKRIITVTAIALMTLVVQVSCVRDNDSDDDVRRTVLVYMSAEHFNSSTVDFNIRGMQQDLGHGMENVVLLAFVDKGNEKPYLLRIRKAKVGDDTGVDTIKVYDEMNTASPDALRTVIDDVKRDYPCDTYGLVLWSHGTGWIPRSHLKFTELGWSAPKRNGGAREPEGLEFEITPDTKAFAVDDVDGKECWMDIDKMAGILHDHEFEFILFDACYMGCVEVLYALRNKADYIVSSGIEIWSEGFPYFNITKDLMNGNLTKVCETFYNYYKNYNNPMAGISLVETRELDSLARCFRKVVAAYDNVAKTDVTNIQSYDWFQNHLFFDLKDFVDRIDSQYKDEFTRQLERCVLYKNSTPYIFKGLPKQRSLNTYCGLSVYIPLEKYDGDNYKEYKQGSLTLNESYRNTEWSSFTGYGY